MLIPLRIFFLIFPKPTAVSCYAKIDSEGNCDQLKANDVTKEECCSVFGQGYNDEISNESIFMLAAGIKKETCKPCRGL